MLGLLPASLHRTLYRMAHLSRHWMRRTFKFRIYGVSAILCDEQGRVLLVRHSYGPRSWALPGGGHGRAENPDQAVRREIREELGIEIEALELVTTLQEELSGAPHTASIFAGVAVGEPRPDRREVTEAQFFDEVRLPLPLAVPTLERLDLWKVHRARGYEAGQSKDS